MLVKEVIPATIETPAKTGKPPADATTGPPAIARTLAIAGMPAIAETPATAKKVATCKNE